MTAQEMLWLVASSHSARTLHKAEYNLNLQACFTFSLETWTMKYLVPSELNDGLGFVKAIPPWHKMKLEEWDCLTCN